MVPTLSAPGDSCCCWLRIMYADEGGELIVSAVGDSTAQVFCTGMKIALFRGLYAPAGQFFPPFVVGQIRCSSFALVKVASGFTVTAPVAPSILLTTFWKFVGLAHRNSPVCRSSV